MKNIFNQVFLSKLKFKVKDLMALSITVTLMGCLPLAADDFTVLDKDVFSNLLRESYSSVNLTPGDGYGIVGVGRIDQSKAASFANNLFVEQKRSSIQKVFLENNGVCNATATRNEMICSFVRKWMLKNSWGGPGTENWPDPAAKVEMKFMFDDSDRITNLILKIIDITEHKEIKG